eukprot:Gb_07167 [translate_table: standard]
MHQHQAALSLLFDSSHISNKILSSSTMNAPGGDVMTLMSGELTPKLQREFGVTECLDRGIPKPPPPIEVFTPYLDQSTRTSIEVFHNLHRYGSPVVSLYSHGSPIEVFRVQEPQSRYLTAPIGELPLSLQPKFDIGGDVVEVTGPVMLSMLSKLDTLFGAHTAAHHDFKSYDCLPNPIDALLTMAPSLQKTPLLLKTPNNKYKKHVTWHGGCNRSSCGKGWLWKSVSDSFVNGAYVITFGRGEALPFYKVWEMFKLGKGGLVVSMTSHAEALDCTSKSTCI